MVQLLPAPTDADWHAMQFVRNVRVYQSRRAAGGPPAEAEAPEEEEDEPDGRKREETILCLREPAEEDGKPPGAAFELCVRRNVKTLP